MSGFMNPLAGGAAAATGTGPRARGTGSYGTGRDPLMRLYGQTDLFSNPKYQGLTDSQKTLGMLFHGKGLKGPLGDMYEQPPARRDNMKIHSFDKEHTPNTSSSREYIPPEYKGEYKSLLSARAPGAADDPASHILGGIIDQERRNRDLLIDPNVQGVKTDRGKRRGGSGKSRGGKKGEGKGNYYEDKASGTGVHT